MRMTTHLSSEDSRVSLVVKSFNGISALVFPRKNEDVNASLVSYAMRMTKHLSPFIEHLRELSPLKWNFEKNWPHGTEGGGERAND
jgi:hypothetical protein